MTDITVETLRNRMAIGECEGLGAGWKKAQTCSDTPSEKF